MRFIKKLFSRFPFVALTIIVLFVAFVLAVIFGVLKLNSLLVERFPSLEPSVAFVYTAVSWIIVAVAIFHVANRDMVPETKIPWILCMTLLNVFGVAIYVVFSSHRPSRADRKRYTALYRTSKPFLDRKYSPQQLRESMGHWAAVSEALSAVEPYAVVRGGTKTEYFPMGEDFFARALEDLEKAEKFIFLEYFIIERGVMWNSILEILKRKVKEGVEVRMMYDDIGCMGNIHLRYHSTLSKMGIKCVKFNPFVPVVTNVHNNRDHRKILIIDGKIAYTGGVNLADEYINVKQPFGRWKDCAVRLEGEGVTNLTLLFLTGYDTQVKRVEDFSPYIPSEFENFGEQGFVQAYGSGPSPLYEKHLAEDVYINIVNGAHEYIYITTPYLIIDYRMREALVLAARRGVDVRILVPHIPDKKIVFALTRSNYAALIRGGVKIYEYTPGFMHTKSMVADGVIATVGTVNLDYRSFLYHFEDSVLMFKTQAVTELEEDLRRAFEESALQTMEDAKRNVIHRAFCEFVKIFAPLF